MREKLDVSITLQDWELEEFQTLCDELGWLMELMLEQFVKWCIEDSERAEEWLMEEIG